MKKLATAVLVSIALGACAQKPTPPPAPAAPPPPPPPTKAQAVLKPATGKAKGMIHFTDLGGGKLQMEVMVEGLKAGPHGFHIHENGDCSGKDFSAAGGHFNPEHLKHGGPTGSEHHAGDLGNLMVDKKGKATVTITADGLDLGPGPHGIVGKSVVVHKGKDDLKSQPAGNSGARVLCGVIEAM